MRYRRLAAIAVFLLAPVTVVSLALAAHHATLVDLHPSWNDDVNYWNEIACFARAGFHGGYCVYDERVAPAKWSHFGAHGPALAVLYGLPARIVGWHAASAPFFNLVALALGSGVWVWLARPDGKQLATAIALIATFWPVLLHVPATYQDTLHGAIALVLAGLAQLAFRDSPSPRGFWPFLIAASLASLVRITWALALIPWAIVSLPGLRPSGKATVLTATGVAIPALTLTWGTICAPFGDELGQWIGAARMYPSSTFWNLLFRWQQEWSQFLRPSSAGPVSILQRYEIIALLIFGAATMIARKHARAGTFAALNLLVVLAPTMLIYGTYDWRDYRVLFPHVLLSLLVVLMADYRWVWPFIVGNLLLVGAFLTQFSLWTQPRLRGDVAAPFRAAVERFVRFDEAAGPWRNTILIPRDLWSTTLEGLPPGVGATMYLHDEWLKLPVQSHWVLLHDQKPEHFGRLRWLAAVPVDADPPTAELYENLDCPDGTP